MTHPTNEQLLDFHYDELDAAQAEPIAAHVRACPQCQSQLATWRGVGGALATWDLPETARRVRMPETSPTSLRSMWLGRSLRAAAAVVLLVGSGYGLARFTEKQPTPAAPVATATVDTEALRAQVTRDVRRELGKEIRNQQIQFAAEMREREQAFQEIVNDNVAELERRQISLRRDVETVAIHAQKELNQLALSARPEGEPSGLRDQ